MIETHRLILRQWRDEDYPVFAQLNADPAVMRYFPALMTTEQSHQQAGRLKKIIADQGWGFWAVELKTTGAFIGFIGLLAQSADSGIPHAPFIEAGWRLQEPYWGQGYATEGASRAIRFAFEELAAPAVYAFTAQSNIPSRRVMEKVGMINTGDDFTHPKVPAGHALARHCLYCVTRERWLKLSATFEG